VGIAAQVTDLQGNMYTSNFVEESYSSSSLILPSTCQLSRYMGVRNIGLGCTGDAVVFEGLWKWL
jgi:hypothetical protein